jgi:hypothetical protein
MQWEVYSHLVNRQHYGPNKGANYMPATAFDSGTISEPSLESTVARLF